MTRIHVVMADEVLETIDHRVGARGRSRFLEEAAREKLMRMELEEVLRSTMGIAGGRRYRHWRDRRTSAAWVREGRRAKFG